MLDNKDKSQITGDYSQNKVDIDMTSLAHKLSEKEKKIIADLLESDPLGDSYKKCLLVYLVVAIVLLLWPFDFISSTPKNEAAWLKKTNGIEFFKAGKIISELPAKSLYNQMLSGSGLSLEVWAAPATTDQLGPARIISYSLDSSRRNFMLGQFQQDLIMRLRTSKTDRNGVYPHMVVDDVFKSTKPQHITVTYDFTKQRIYVNGEMRTEKTIPGGDFKNWNPSYFLVMGSEVTGDRPWAGRLFYVSIYNRVLEPHEVHHNFMAGDFRKTDSQKETKLVSSGLVARYFFDEHTGDTIKDSSGNASPLNLYFPDKLKPNKKRFLSFSFSSSFSHFANFRDIFINIIIFIPFAFLFSGAIQRKRRSIVNIFFIVVITGSLFTLSIETIQYFSMTRHSSLIDVTNNILGTILGVAFFRSWKKLLKSQSKQLEGNSFF